MRFQNSALGFILVLSFSMIGCFGEDPKPSSNKETNTPKTNENAANKANKNAKNPLSPEKTPPRETKVAVTLKPVVDAYCAAINKGDDASLQKIYSTASWKFLSADARSEGKKSVAKYLSESEPIGNKCQVVNERISGKLAEATVITQTYPNGVPLKFVNEGGEWKMTNQSSDFDAVRKSSK